MRGHTQRVLFRFAIVLSAGVYAETGASQSSSTASLSSAATRAACLDRFRQAMMAGTSQGQLDQIRHECIRISLEGMQPGIRPLNADTSIYDRTTRATIAAQDADRDGNYRRAAELFRSIDADSNAIKAEAARGRDPGDLLRQLARAQRHLGAYDEQAGNYAAAAAYYQKALTTMNWPNGVEMLAVYRLGFLYVNGLGVRRDTKKAREYFSWRDDQRNRVALTLLDHNMLPRIPEDITPALISSAENMRAADDRRQALDGQIGQNPLPIAERTSQTGSSAADSMTVDRTFICESSDPKTPLVIISTDSLHKMLKHEYSTVNLHVLCIHMFKDRAFAPTGVGESAAYCNMLSGNGNVHQSVTIDNRSAIVRITGGDVATSTLSIDFSTGIFRGFDGSILKCELARP
jgi:hypothetical protein